MSSRSFEFLRQEAHLGLSLSLLSSFSIIFPNFYHEGRGKIEVTTYAKTANPQTYAINENCLVGREVKKKNGT
jgi:hypothetical protein